jgi:hypothetical protein
MILRKTPAGRHTSLWDLNVESKPDEERYTVYAVDDPQVWRPHLSVIVLRCMLPRPCCSLAAFNFSWRWRRPGRAERASWQLPNCSGA